MRFPARRRGRLPTIAVTAALWLSACAGAQGVGPATSLPIPTTSSSPTPETIVGTDSAPSSVYGGTLVVGIADGGAPRSLNPFLEGADTRVLDMLIPALFAQGYDIDPETGSRVGDAFAAVPSIEAGTVVENGDGTIDVTVEIVDGARWADGVPITGHDLEFTYRLATDPSLPIRADVAGIYSAIVPGSPRVDGRSLTFRMSAAGDPTDLFSTIIPRHAVEAFDFAREWTDRLWVSGGPFVLSDWQPGQFVELSRNENYWKVTQAESAPLPFVDRIVIRFYEPGDLIDPRLVDAFNRGEVDVAVFDRAESRATDFESARVNGALIETAPSGEWEHLNFQFGPANRNSDSRNASTTFRKAVAHAIDREVLAAARGTSVADSILDQFVPGLGDQPFSVYDFDLQAVSDVIGDEEPPMLLTVPGDDPATVALGGSLVTMLRAAGFDAELQLEDASLFFGATLDNGSWDVSAWRFGAGSGLGAAVDFLRFFDPDGLPLVGVNFFRWGTVDSAVSNDQTRRYLEIIDALDQTTNPEIERELLVEAESILADQVVILPLILAGELGIAYWPEAVTGVRINRVQGPLWNVDTWRVPTR